VKVLGVDHVQLAMPRGREDEVRAFYGDLLGLSELAKPANLAARGGVWFAAGEQQIHLGIEDDFRPAMKAHPALVVEGLDEFRRFYVSDPFGNRLEFIEPTHTTAVFQPTAEQREAARSLARLGGSQPHLKPVPRRRPPYR
jgi:catechol 2,3-dioxygenase-like lactoylglutathione lyase family enzyme